MVAWFSLAKSMKQGGLAVSVRRTHQRRWVGVEVTPYERGKGGRSSMNGLKQMMELLKPGPHSGLGERFAPEIIKETL